VIAPASPSSATGTAIGCITASGPGVDACPLGSPHISSVDTNAAYGATSTGSVYSETTFPGQVAGVSALHLVAPIIGIVSPTEGEYWLAGADGGIFSFGGLPFLGSMGGQPLNKPIVGIVDDGETGYWVVASDGGVFAFGSAGFFGSTGGRLLNEPIVGIAPTPDGRGYWLVASDGGVFTFGDAQFYGSRGGQQLNSPIVAMAATTDGQGYWLASSDGGIFTYGDAPFYGSDLKLGYPVLGIAAWSPFCPPAPPFTCPRGYSIALSNGQRYAITS
jgi:hypothetical protein